MRKYLALPVIVAAFAANMWAGAEARMNGKILDSAGKPVADATITVDAIEAKKVHQVFKSDKKGNFSFVLIDGTIRYRFTYAKEGVGTFTEEKKPKLIPESNETTITLGAETASTTTSSGGTVTSKADPATVAYNEGAALANSGDTAGAIAKMEEATKANAEFTAAWIALTKLYARTSQWPKVITAGTKALAVDEEQADLNALMAEAYRKTGDNAKAAEYAKKAPKNASATFNEAAKLINAGKNAEAEPLLKEVIATDPTFAQAYYELGMMYAGQSKKAEAKANLTKYLELAPTGKDAQTAKEMLNYIK